MTDFPLTKVGDQLISIRAITCAKWEGEKLWLYFEGGRFTHLSGDRANAFWNLLALHWLDIDSPTITTASEGVKNEA